MTDEKVEKYVTIPGKKGLVRVLISKRPRVGGAAGDGEQDERDERERREGRRGGYLPSSYRPDDDIPYLAQPNLYFYDLGTRLIPAGQASYVERKGLIPVRWLEPYEDSEYKRWQDEMLGALLGEGHEEEADPTGTSIIASSDKKRKAPNVWPWTEPGMAGTPDITLRLKAGATFPGDWSARTKEVSIAGEDWAAINTAEELAPSYSFWKVKGQERYDGIGVVSGRYLGFLTYDLIHYKVTEESFFTAPAVEFKMAWPIKVFGVPRLWHAVEGRGIQTIAGGAQYTERTVTERGLLSSGARYYWLQTKTARSTIYTLGVPLNNWGENGQHSLAHYPLIPKPYRIPGGPPPAEFFLSQMPASAYRTFRTYHFRLQRAGSVIRERYIPGAGISPRITVSSYGPTVRAITNKGADGRSAELFGRRPLLAAQIESLALSQIKAEISSDMGRSFDSVPGSVVTGVQSNGDHPDYSYSGTAQITFVRTSTLPEYEPFEVGQPRVGHLVGIVMCKGKKYFVWKKA